MTNNIILKHKTIKNVPESLWKDLKILSIIDSIPLSDYVIMLLEEGITSRKNKERQKLNRR